MPIKDNKGNQPGLIKNSKESIQKAQAVLRKNYSGLYTRPVTGLYPHQVLWDSCFIAIGESNYDSAAAKRELKSLIRGQWKNGMAPNIIFDEAKKYKFDRRIWRSHVSPYSAKVATSGITQPPMMSEAVRIVGSKLSSQDKKDFYSEMIGYLVAHHEWLYRERNSAKNGLIAQIHPWETGLDTTPPWMRVMHDSAMPVWIKFLNITKLEKIGSLFRTDDKFVSSSERASNIESLALYNVLRHLRTQKYTVSNVLKDADFAVADLTFNSILVRSNEALVQIAKDINFKLPKDLIDGIKNTKMSFDKFWDDNTREYYSMNLKNEKLIIEPSVAALMPLYSGAISKERAAELVKLLEEPSSFSTKYPIPSVPINSKWFKPNRYWQGPTWININWFIIQGLNSYGYYGEAKTLKQKTIKLVEDSGFFEYFNPLTGEGFGADNFSWTAALTIDLLLNS